MIRFLYGAVMTLLVPLFWVCLRFSAKDGAYGGRIGELLGGVPARDYGRPVWFHTVSVGESAGALPLIRKFRELHPGVSILVTTSTPTGAAVYKNAGFVTHLYAPLDAPFCVKRFVGRTAPRALVIMETELWPAALGELRARGVPVCLINARLSERSKNRYKKAGRFFRSLIGDCLTGIVCQTESDRANFAELGVPPGVLSVSGSLKFDVEPEPDSGGAAAALRASFGSRPALCAASTHPGEDEIVLDIFRKAREQIPGLLLILVPRHPEDFARARDLAVRRGFATACKNGGKVTADTDVLIGNTMGEMPLYFRAADLVLMAGSLLDVGGHNPLEAVAAGVPVVSGPHVRNFKKIYGDLAAAGGCVVAANEDLPEVAARLLADAGAREKLAAGAAAALGKNRGATARTLALLPGIIGL